MDVARQALQSLRYHFEEVFWALETDEGRPFTRMAALPVPQNEDWKYVFFMELWSTALESNSKEAFHALALFTPADMLDNVLSLAVQEHSSRAIVPLLACMERRDGWNRHNRLRLIQCSQKRCGSCREVRSHLLKVFDLAADWELCRAKMQEARRRNLWSMWQPHLALHEATDVVFAQIKSQNRRNVTSFAAVVLAVVMWKRWIKRRLQPDSSFVLDVLATRWGSMCLQTWKPAVEGWGGDLVEED